MRRQHSPPAKRRQSASLAEPLHARRPLWTRKKLPPAQQASSSSSSSSSKGWKRGTVQQQLLLLLLQLLRRLLQKAQPRHQPLLHPPPTSKVGLPVCCLASATWQPCASLTAQVTCTCAQRGTLSRDPPRPAAAAEGGRRSSGRVRAWPCALCTLENAPSARRCSACGAKKPAGEAAAAAGIVLVEQQQVGC
jgi:hypothetical protein